MASEEAPPESPAGRPSGAIPSMWVALILLGIALMVVGVVVATSSDYLITREPTGSPTCDRDLVKNIRVTGSILGQGGGLLLVLGLFGGASLTRGLEASVRASIFIGGTIILVFSLTALRFVGTGLTFC